MELHSKEYSIFILYKKYATNWYEIGKNGLCRKLVILKRDIQREEKDFEMKENEAHEFACLSLENYLKALKSSSMYDLSIFRLVALWLENVTKEKPNNLVSRHPL